MIGARPVPMTTVAIGIAEVMIVPTAKKKATLTRAMVARRATAKVPQGETRLVRAQTRPARRDKVATLDAGQSARGLASCGVGKEREVHPRT